MFCSPFRFYLMNSRYDGFTAPSFSLPGAKPHDPFR
jgi:hypothetical protein